MVMTAVRNPKITLNLVSRDQTVGLEEHRVLLVGQKLAAGTSAAGHVTNLPRTLAEIDTLFGARSHLAMMARKFRSINQYTRVDAIALADNGSGVKATSKIVFAGTATSAATVYFDVVSSTENSYKVDIEVDDAPGDISTKILAAIALDARAPFTAALSTTTGTDDTITFTAANGGTLANGWLLRVRDAYNRRGDIAAAGVTMTLTAWASGATDPSLTGVLDATSNIRYNGVVWPQSWSTALAKSWINARFNLDNDIKDGVVFQWVNDTLTNAKAQSLAMNSPSWVHMWNLPMSTAYWKGPYLPEAPDVLVATFVAARARRFERNISISDLVVNNESRDQFGGIHTASLPYFNTPMLNIQQPQEGFGSIQADQADAEDHGLMIVGANVQNNNVIAGVVVTSYSNDAAGNPDDTWKYLEWRDTHSAIREFIVNNLRSDFAQHRLTSGNAVANFAMADEALIRAAIYGYYDLLTDDALTVRGRDAHSYMEQKLVVQIVPAERLVRLSADVPMVSQFGEAIGSIKFSFGPQQQAA